MVNLVTFKIDSVVDNNTGKPSKNYSYRVGRLCEIDLSRLKEGTCLMVQYTSGESKGEILKTSIVEKITEDCYGFEVKTRNRTYFFKYVPCENKKQDILL